MKLPPLPEGCPARFRCESCEGSGRDGHMMYQGEFQPPEDGPCPDCDGRGWHLEKSSVDVDQMRAYGEACARAALEEAARLMEPKMDRPCDCVVCDCGNSGDRAFVMAWDADKERAQAIRAIEVTQ